MARLARLCVPGWPHLLVQLGHNRQPVFRDESDSNLFLDLLKEAATSHGVAIHAYALLNNEVRLLVTPSTSAGLSQLMQATGRRYGAAFNKRHAHAGSLWQGRFRATVIEPERHLLQCMRFAEGLATAVSNSTGLGSVVSSSAPHYFGEQAIPFISEHPNFWVLGNTPFEREANYRELAQQALTVEEVNQISESVQKGWPLGSAAFLRQLSLSTDRRLTPLQRGRPRTSQISGPN